MGFRVQIRNHATGRLFKQAGDHRMHQGRTTCQNKPRSEATSERRMFTIAFVDGARMRKKNPCQHKALLFMDVIL